MNVPAIITALGGRYQTQKLLNVGSSAISNYIARGQFPEQKKCTIFEILEKKGYTVHPQNLEILAVPNEKAYSTLNTPTRILLVISGGIALKALEIARQLIKRGANVTTIIQSAKELRMPCVSALTGEKCYHELSLTDEEEMGREN